MLKKYVEEGLEIVGSNHRYQLIIGILLFLIGVSGDMTYTNMPLMETTPIVDISQNGKVIHLEVNYTLCGQNYTIDKDDSRNSWVYDYNIFCNKLLVSLIGSIFCLGGLLGTFFLQYLKEKGAKYSLIIICISLSLSSLLIIYNSIFLFYIFLFINGLSGIIIFMLKINIMTDLTHKHFRSYYNNIIITGGNLAMLINYLLFNLAVDWKIVNFTNSIIMLILIFFFSKIYVDNPRFFFLKNDKEKMMQSLMYIAKFNKLDKELNFKEKLDNYFSYLYLNNVELEKHKVGEGDNFTNTNDNISSPIDYELSTTTTSQRTAVINVQPQIQTKRSFLNFILSYPFVNFLYFVYMIEIKEFSYIMHSYVYIYCILSIFVSFLLSPLMNCMGRVKSKILLLSTFVVFFIIPNFFNFTRNTLVIIYLTNRLILHSCSMINHTHINEAFPSNIRLKVFATAFAISKTCLLVAPFVYEYFKPFNTFILLTISAFLLVAFGFQQETSNKILEDI